jgi:hypothetical protein
VLGALVALNLKKAPKPLPAAAERVAVSG